MAEERRYRIEVERQAERTLRRLPKDLLERMRTAIRGLAAEPRPDGRRITAAVGHTGRRRIYWPGRQLLRHLRRLLFS